MNRSFVSRAIRPVVGACVVAMLAACGGAPEQGSSSGGGQPPVTTAGTQRPCSTLGSASCYSVSLSLSGAQTFSGTALVPNQHGCQTVLADNASSNAGEVTLGAAVSGKDGSAVTLSVLIERYSGPGNYTQDNNDAYVSILTGDSEFNAQYGGASTKITASAQPDGSVSISFTDLGAATGQQRLSGTADFKCENA